MEVKGIVRNLDPVGRIVIPKEFRRTLDIQPGDPIEIILKGEEITLRKYRDTCIFCGSDKDLVEFKEKVICKTCRKSISSL